MAAIHKLVILAFTLGPVVLAQESATVTGPDVVMAGDTVDLRISLNKAPEADGTYISISVSCPSWGPQTGSPALGREQKVWDYRPAIPADLPSGTCDVNRIEFCTGRSCTPLRFNKLSFRVTENPRFVRPTSAEVTINPSQVQLLRREASRLRARRQALSEAIAGADEPLKQATVDLLRGSLQQELESLKTTESKFGELGSKVQAEATRVFFDDLRLSYTGVLSGLGQETVGRSNVTMMRAAWSLPPQTTPVDSNRHSLTTQSVFEIIELNARAYALVADAEALTFDLDVKSNPEGAIVSYRRRGDAYKDHPSPTNSTIRFLTYAIWTVRFRKKGYEEQEFEFNPFVESNHVISVNLVK